MGHCFLPLLATFLSYYHSIGAHSSLKWLIRYNHISNRVVTEFSLNKRVVCI